MDSAGGDRSGRLGAWSPQLCVRLGWGYQLTEGINTEHFGGKPCGINKTGYNATRWFWGLIGGRRYFVALILMVRATNSRVFSFLPSSETSYIGPFFFLLKENSWIIQLNYVLQEKSKGNERRWKDYTTRTVVWDQVWSQSDEAFSPVQGVRDENSKHLGSGFRGQKGMEWGGNYSSDRHHDSLVVKTEIK